jgi:YD repeat-containing protein
MAMAVALVAAACGEIPDFEAAAQDALEPGQGEVDPAPLPGAGPLSCPEVPALVPGPAPADTRAVSAACPAPARPSGPWHGRATHPVPAGAGDTSRLVETEVGPALYWRVGDDHFVSVADPVAGQWGPDLLVATDTAAFNAVIGVCDGVLIDLVDESDPLAFIHLHLARPDAETVSRTMGASYPENFRNITHWPVLTATRLEVHIRDAFDSCSILLETEPLDAQTLASLDRRSAVLDPGSSAQLVPKTRFAGANFGYALRGVGDALVFEREGAGLPPFSREIPLPPGGAALGAPFGAAVGPAGELFVFIAGSPRDGQSRLLQLDTGGRRVTPDRLLDQVAGRSVSLVSWSGGVALAFTEAAGTTLVALDDPDLVPDLATPCMTDALGRCGVGQYEADGEGWRCVTPAPADEVCNAADDDCDGLTDEAPAGCDFHFTGPAISPRPPLSCPLTLIPWPELLGASDPNPDPCQAFANARPCRVGAVRFGYDAAGHLLRAGGRAYAWDGDHLTGGGGARLAFDAAGRLVTEDRGVQGRSTFTYDRSGRLLTWDRGGWVLEYVWAPDGQSVTVRHMYFGAIDDFDVEATLVGGVVSEVHSWVEYAGSVSPAGDPRCGTAASFAANDSGYAAGDELREGWGRRFVLDSAGRQHASSGGGGYRQDDSNPRGESSASETTWRFDDQGRPSAKLTCQRRDFSESCLLFGDHPPGPTCTVETIAYDCP